MKYLSLFSGVGGFELGIYRAYQQKPENNMAHNSDGTKSWSEPQLPTCIGYSEIDKYAIETYEHNWKGHRNYGDATKIDERQLPDFDLLVGGFPCQAFSVAGKRHGFNETRGTLFFDIARILSHKRPRHFLLENVKGLLSHDGGKTITTMLGVLTDLGYVVEWQVLNAKGFGVPQNRERVFIVGHLGGECGRQVFPIGGTNETRLEKSPTIIGSSQRHAKVSKDGIVPTLSQAMGQGGGQTPMALTETRTDEAKAIRLESQKQGKDWSSRRGKVLKPRQDGIGNMVTAAQSKEHYLSDGVKIRRLTPTECERLMSWPDNWTIGSDTQRYKQCGNGVVSNVVSAVMERLKPCLL